MNPKVHSIYINNNGTLQKYDSEKCPFNQIVFLRNINLFTYENRIFEFILFACIKLPGGAFWVDVIIWVP